MVAQKAGNGSFCGVYKKPFPTIPITNSRTSYVYDRFGNVYTEDELLLMRSRVYTACDAGAFKLEFASNANTPFPQPQQDLICRVFQYVSDQVQGGNTAYIPILITREPTGSMPSGVLGTGTPFWADNCDLAHTDILEQLLLGQSTLPPSAPVASIRILDEPLTAAGICPDPCLSSGWFVTSSLNDPVTSCMYDLYTVVLHEAMHCMGFASRIGLDGSYAFAGDYYTFWDKFLVADNATNYLVKPSNNGKCCAAREFNANTFPQMPFPLNDPQQIQCDLNIGFSDGTNILAPVNSPNVLPNSDGEMANKLSHLPNRCSTDEYVMNPTLAACAHTREFSQAELDILCQLGYKTDSGCANCLVIANDDKVPTTLVLTGTGQLTSVFVPFEHPTDFALLNNDAYTDITNITIEIIPNCGSYVPGVNLNITQPTPDGFTIEGLQEGLWTFCYKISCGDNCDQAEVNILVIDELIDVFCSNDNCNLVCFGDFEDFMNGEGDYLSQIGVNPFPSYVDPDINLDNSNKFLNFQSDNVTGSETALFPLSTPIPPGADFTLRYDRALFSTRTPPQVQLPISGEIRWHGFDGSVCPDNQFQYPFGCSSTSTICPNGNFYCLFEDMGAPAFPNPTPPGVSWAMGSGSTTAFGIENFFENITSPVLTNNTGAPIKTLFLTATGGPDVIFVTMDNLEVLLLSTPQVTITPTIMESCQNGLFVIQYDLELNSSSPAIVTVDLEAILPSNIPGIQVVSGGGFNANGNTKAKAAVTLTTSGTTTATVTLTFETGPNLPVGFTLPVDLILNATGACINSSQGDADVVVVVEDCNPSPPSECPCPIGTPSLIVGLPDDPTSVRYASNYLNFPISNACIEVNGRLIWDLPSTPLSYVNFIMHEGAEIFVDNGRTFEADNCTFVGCTSMWRGITTAPQGATINLSACTIQDAQYAVELSGVSAGTVSSSTFTNNYVGVFIPSSNAVNGNTVTLEVSGSTFSGRTFNKNGHLKPAYTGQLPDPRTFGYAAFEFHDNKFRIVDLINNNSIDSLKNGLIAYNASVEMSNATISNLVSEYIPNFPGILTQRGIYLSNGSILSATNVEIKDAFIGVESINSGLSLQDCTISGLQNEPTPSTHGADPSSWFERSVLVSGSSGHSIELLNNTFTTWHHAIHLDRMVGTSSLNVTSNNIYFTGNPISASYNYTVPQLYAGPIKASGLSIYGAPTGNIENNFIFNASIPTNQSVANVVADGIGFQSEGCQNLRFVENFVYNHRNSFYDGGGFRNSYIRNRAVNNSSNTPNKAFQMFNSMDWYCSNILGKQTETGFYLAGASNPSYIHCNTIREANLGMFLENGTRIGQQFNPDNKWIGPFGWLGAYHAGLIGDIDNSLFFRPLAGTPTNQTAAGVPLFRSYDPPMNQDCSCTDNPFEFIEGKGQYLVEGGTQANNESIVEGGENENINWMNQERLFTRISNQAALIGDSEILRSFYEKNQAQSLGQLSILRAKIEEALQGDVLYQLEMQRIHTEIQTLLKDIQVLQNQGVTGTEILDKQSLLQSWMRYQEAGIQYLQVHWTEQSKVILQDLENIHPENNLAKNEYTVFQLALENGLYQGKKGQEKVLEQIRIIADQCPLEGGFAVYDARTLYRSYYPVSVWLDEKCVSEGRENKEDNLAEEWSLYPNPAHEILEISLPKLRKGSSQIFIHDVSGILRYETTVAEEQDVIRIKTATFSEGMYIVQVKNAFTRTIQKPFIVIH